MSRKQIKLQVPYKSSKANISRDILLFEQWCILDPKADWVSASLKRAGQFDEVMQWLLRSSEDLHETIAFCSRCYGICRSSVSELTLERLEKEESRTIFPLGMFWGTSATGLSAKMDMYAALFKRCHKSTPHPMNQKGEYKKNPKIYFPKYLITKQDNGRNRHKCPGPPVPESHKKPQEVPEQAVQPDREPLERQNLDTHPIWRSLIDLPSWMQQHNQILGQLDHVQEEKIQLARLIHNETATDFIQRLSKCLNTSSGIGDSQTANHASWIIPSTMGTLRISSDKTTHRFDHTKFQEGIKHAKLGSETSDWIEKHLFSMENFVSAHKLLLSINLLTLIDKIPHELAVYLTNPPKSESPQPAVSTIQAQGSQIISEQEPEPNSPRSKESGRAAAQTAKLDMESPNCGLAKDNKKLSTAPQSILVSASKTAGTKGKKSKSVKFDVDDLIELASKKKLTKPTQPPVVRTTISVDDLSDDEPDLPDKPAESRRDPNQTTTPTATPKAVEVVREKAKDMMRVFDEEPEARPMYRPPITSSDERNFLDEPDDFGFDFTPPFSDMSDDF